MKSLVFVIFIAVEVAYSQLPDMNVEQAQCIKELNLDASKIRKYAMGMDEMSKDEKCVLRCVLQKVGAIDKNGAPIEDEIDKKFLKERNIDISKCIPPSSVTDPCEKTYMLTKCVADLFE